MAMAILVGCLIPALAGDRSIEPPPADEPIVCPTAGPLALGDFDGDGVSDVAMVRADPDSIAILLGRPNGGFETGIRFAVGDGPLSVVSGRVDGDPLDDLVAFDRESRTATVLLGDGTGAFFVAGTIQLDPAATAIGLGDMSGDGITDLVTTTEPAGDLAVFVGDGTGSFDLLTVLSVTPSPIGLAGAEPDPTPGLPVLEPIGGSPAAPAAGPGVSSLTLNPATIQGGSGGTSTGTVTLTGPAPPGGQRVELSSSNTELAATPISVTVPSGQTSMPFAVATNPEFRKYSGLSFVAVISASANGASKSANLTVTAQPQPPAVTSDSCQREGLSCGGASISGLGEYGILYQCKKAATCNGTVGGPCTFKQECSLYCRTEPSPNGLKYQDACGTTPPILIRLGPKYTEGGKTSVGTVTLSEPAPPDGATVTVTSPSPFVTLPPYNSIAIPPGGTTTTFTIGTSQVSSPQFAKIKVGVQTREPLPGGGVFFRSRTQLAWLTLVQPDTCTPTTCIEQGKNCGTISDGCGGSLDCGTCAPSETCGGGGVANVCGVCTPTSCAAQGKNCGTISDGCGGTLDCGTCTAPQTCGGGGTANVCGSGASLTVTATGRSGERVRSSPAGIDVPVGQTQSADFAVGTTLTLSATNNRDVIWSGVCSSNGQKTKTCTFTIQSNSSETANVQ